MRKLRPFPVSTIGAIQHFMSACELSHLTSSISHRSFSSMRTSSLSLNPLHALPVRDKELPTTPTTATTVITHRRGDDSSQASHATSKQTLSRRGHLKSRFGCFNCKRRRVKCNEGRPTCEHCRRLELVCVYPTAIPTSNAGTVRRNPSLLALEELRFYHHFFTRSFPTLPFHGEELWKKCTAMSHEVVDFWFVCLSSLTTD